MNEATKANFHDPIFERRPTVLQPRAAIGTKGVSPLSLYRVRLKGGPQVA